jgi:hypothetical protein
LDYVAVVERGARHHHAADFDRAQQGDWREYPGAPHLDDDVLYAGDFATRLELVCHRPARVVGDGAEPLTRLEVIELDDDAVDRIIECVALRSPPRVVRDDRIGIGGSATLSGTRRPQARRA